MLLYCKLSEIKYHIIILQTIKFKVSHKIYQRFGLGESIQVFQFLRSNSCTSYNTLYGVGGNNDWQESLAICAHLPHENWTICLSEEINKPN